MIMIISSYHHHMIMIISSYHDHMIWWQAGLFHKQQGGEPQLSARRTQSGDHHHQDPQQDHHHQDQDFPQNVSLAISSHCPLAFVYHVKVSIRPRTSTKIKTKIVDPSFLSSKLWLPTCEPSLNCLRQNSKLWWRNQYYCCNFQTICQL